MNAITKWIEEGAVDAARMDGDAEYRREVFEGFRATTTMGIIGMADALHKMEEHGDELPPASEGMLRLLRRIGSGEMLPETLVAFDWNKTIQARVSHYSIHEQRELLETPARPVAVKNNGQYEERLIIPSEMGATHLKQVFGEFKTRTVRQQVAWLEAQRAKGDIEDKPTARDDHAMCNAARAAGLEPREVLKREIAKKRA